MTDPEKRINPGRRRILGGLGALCALACVPLAAAGAKKPRFAYVGTYTPNGGGIYLFEVDPASGEMTQRDLFGDIRNPSWIALNPAHSMLYAVSEVDDFGDNHSGSVSSFAIDAASGALTRIGTVSSGGANPAHMSVHPSGKYVFVGNYTGGSVAVFPVNADGSLAEPSDMQHPTGPLHAASAALDPKGQFGISDHAGSHIHMVQSDPRGEFVIANDAGLDQTLIWRLDQNRGRLSPAATAIVDAPAGSAPRHFAFHPNGRIFYNLHEHDGQLVVYGYDPATGALSLRQSQSALPKGFAGSNLSSELLVSPDGRFVYVGNRLHDSIMIFRVDKDGTLACVGDEWVRADYPRSMVIDPSGTLLFSCNQKGDSITSFRISPSTGELRFTGRYQPVGSPVVMAFLS